MRVGVFDSGVGGLTVVAAISQRLPGAEIRYLGDTARLPYGSKSPETVKRYALGAARHLSREGIDVLVIACNTASAAALPLLEASLPVPVLGVVEPGAKAAIASGARRVGVLGTRGTIASEAYPRALAAIDASVEVRQCACPLFVPLAEEGWQDHQVTRDVAAHYLRPLLEWGVEALILGCTHYPLISTALAETCHELGARPSLIDSAETTAAALAELTGELPGSGSIHLELTDLTDSAAAVAKRLLPGLESEIERIDLRLDELIPPDKP